MINSEFVKRFLSSIILIPLIVFIVLFKPFVIKYLLLILLIISLFEWTNIISNKFIIFLGYLFILFSFYSAFQISLANSKYFFLILMICISTDIGGYIFGNIFKGPKLTKISPNKTYSGLIGSFFLTLLIFFILTEFYISSSFINVFNVYLVLILSFISQIGDLIISYFKRINNIKDTGSFIPGHGGLLDRIDGMLFVFPSFFITQLNIFNF